MNNIVIVPLLIPLISGLVMIFVRSRHVLQQWIAILASLGTLAVSLYLIRAISQDGVLVLHLGGWPAPYGIALVADMLPALLLASSAIVTLACLLYSIRTIGEARKQYYVYPLIMILLAGVNGSFLTGDIFNLFVFFEVLLIASYVLLSLGGEKKQLRETIKYVIINMISSTLFVIAIAYLYSVTGTLSMAHLSERIAASGQDGLLTTISLLFLIVFSIKSGLLLFFWLPGSYSAAPAPIAALFAALLTKVGIYAIIRLFTLVFYHDPEWTQPILITMAALTMILGAIGAIASWEIRKILVYNVVVSVGFMLFGIGVFSAHALEGSLFYLLHDMFAKALIFIIGGTVIAIFGTDKLREISGMILFRPSVAWLYFLSALAISGVPPLGGFVGKVMILRGGLEGQHYLVTAISIATSLLVLYSLLKIFIHSFWGETLMAEGKEKSSGRGALLPGALLAVLIVGMGLGAEWTLGYIGQAVDVMTNPAIYIDAVFTR